MKPSFSKYRFFFAGALLLGGCGSLVDMNNRGASGEQRRIYVNDAAKNDSLCSSILRGGVSFVMQPGKKYALQVTSPASGEALHIYVASAGYYNPWKTLLGVSQGGVQTFVIEDSGATAANYYLAILQSASGVTALRPSKVRLVPALPRPADSATVHLLMVRQLHGLPDAAKAAYADTLLGTLRDTYALYNIHLKTSYEIVEPGGPPLAVDFSGQPDLPGARRANTIHMYLVDSIYLPNGRPTDIFLGFAPREAFDLASMTQGSQVVLSVRGNGAASVAVTAAHELGHFFGLRHTTPTDLDREGDTDRSNDDDGFLETLPCIGLEKRAAGSGVSGGPEISLKGPGGRQYCLRIAAGPERCNCPDRSNLMFAYSCPFPQKELVSGQQKLLRENTSLFQQ